ncbi:MAG TPA: glycoside hydrolase family 15 protein [Propionibacteriaceae bacterium]|nr:glycoside hydrolase family 15 protein [Propionibacteriaceae bacterium]
MSPRRTKQPPIADYAVLADRQTSALLAHGSVDWMCVPQFDSASVFSRLLSDPDESHWSIVPTDGTERSRHYREGSFVLDTTWTTPTGAAKCTDFMPIREGEGDDPVLDNTVALIRSIECTEGEIDVDHELVIRFDYGLTAPWIRQARTNDGNHVLLAVAGPNSLALYGPRLQAGDRRHSGHFHIRAGQKLTWTLMWRPSYRPIMDAPDMDAELERTINHWREWHSNLSNDGIYSEAVERSLSVLRALTLHRTGGIVAAVTTSLPEAIGGQRNWDYRYTWLRDSAFTISALSRHGHHTVARQWRDWLLRALAGDPEDVQIMYTIEGQRQLPEHTLDQLQGYRGSKPVRVGNGAVDQYQADVIGEVLISLAHLRDDGLDEDDFSWSLQVSLLEHLRKQKNVKDQGMWESRGEPHYYTHGRVMMWAAFDRGVEAIERYGLQGPLDEWRQERDALREEIMSKGVKDGYFVQHYDTLAVDASALQIPQTGFIAYDSDIMLATVDRIEKELMTEQGFVRRYVADGSDGFSSQEGAFLMCTFWLVEQYARSGRPEDGKLLMDKLMTAGNDLQLFSEEYEPSTGEMLGNFPQAFSHLALIRAADAVG